MKPYRCVNGRVQVDIHEMFPADAKKKLEKLLAAVGDEVEVVEVIHGYHGGQDLMQFARHQVHTKNINRRALDLNPGVTVYYLK